MAKWLGLNGPLISYYVAFEWFVFSTVFVLENRNNMTLMKTSYDFDDGTWLVNIT